MAGRRRRRRNNLDGETVLIGLFLASAVLTGVKHFLATHAALITVAGMVAIGVAVAVDFLMILDLLQKAAWQAEHDPGIAVTDTEQRKSSSPDTPSCRTSDAATTN